MRYLCRTTAAMMQGTHATIIAESDEEAMKKFFKKFSEHSRNGGPGNPEVRLQQFVGWKNGHRHYRNISHRPC